MGCDNEVGHSSSFLNLFPSPSLGGLVGKQLLKRKNEMDAVVMMQQWILFAIISNFCIMMYRQEMQFLFDCLSFCILLSEMQLFFYLEILFEIL